MSGEQHWSIGTVPSSNEILARYLERMGQDVLGFEVGQYLPCLPFELAKEFLRDTDKEHWEALMRFHPTREAILRTMEDYLPFAWAKAREAKGMLAARSVARYVAWTWLSGDREFSASLEAEPLEEYGKNVLRRVCERYGWSEG